MIKVEIRAPYLIFVADETSPLEAKTGAGIFEWRPELCKGQLALEGGGLPIDLQLMSIAAAKNAGVKSLIIGTAAIGGGLPDEWLDTLVEALEAGLDIVAGLHQRLTSVPRLIEAARASGANLIDVRIPPTDLPVGTGKKRTGRRVLMVGTDCAIGKKYSALALEKDMKRAGMNADFRASGQTGIMIAGKGIPIDSVVADFVSGAAELLSPDNSANHWDVIEGQGGIIHPGYSPVSMGLLIGSQPDAFVVCHQAGRTHIDGWEHFKLPSIEQVIERVIAIGSQTNPAIRCVGVSVNTSSLDDAGREDYLSSLSKRLNLPCVDCLKDGMDKIISRINTEFPN